MLLGDTTTTPPLIGVAAYVQSKQGLSPQYTLRSIPELSSLPFGGTVSDPTLSLAASENLRSDLQAVKDDHAQAAAALVASLNELSQEHDQALKKQPVTLSRVMELREPAEEWLRLLKAIKGRE